MIRVDCIADSKHELTDLIGFVKPYVPDIPDNGIEHELRQAMVEFAMKTLVLRNTALIDLQENVCDYYLPEDRNGEWVPYIIDEVCLRISSSSEYRQAYIRKTGGCGVHGWSVVVESSSKLWVNPAPMEDIECGLKVDFFVIPTQESCTVPDIIFNTYSQGIAAIAIAKLLLVNGNEALARKAGIWQQTAQRWINKAKHDVPFGGLSTGPKKMRARPWM